MLAHRILKGGFVDGTKRKYPSLVVFRLMKACGITSLKLLKLKEKKKKKKQPEREREQINELMVHY